MSRATSFASVWLFVAITSGLAAPRTLGQATPVPPALEQRVLQQIAEIWAVNVESLHLQWGRLSVDSPLAANASFRLVGNGADGWFAGSFLRDDGSTVAARVRAGVENIILVAARPLETGMELSAGDIRREPQMSWRRPRANQAARPDVGWIVRRPIASGQELAFPAVAQPTVISAGEPVQFTWSRGAVRISLTGVALNAARLGERIRARVTGRSSTHVEGVATGPGTAKLKGGDL